MPKSLPSGEIPQEIRGRELGEVRWYSNLKPLGTNGLLPENPSFGEPVFRWFPAPDGVRLRSGIWGPLPAQRVCVLLNGFSEWLEKYGEVAGELVGRGFTVASFEWRGQGQSARLLEDSRKGHVGDFTEFDADLNAFLDEVIAPMGSAPRFALAHSMGAHILLRRLHGHPTEVSGAVLCSPMLRIQTGRYPQWFTRALALCFNRTVPSEKFVWGAEARDPIEMNFAENLVTSDPARFERAQKFLRDHPEMRICGPTFGWLGAAFRSMDMLQRSGFPEAIATPLLIIAARHDQIVDTEATHDFAQRLPNAHYVEIAEAEHEMLMEVDSVRAQFWAAFDEFVSMVLGR